ncbi:hypothetical protein [Paenibacillus guangzhouensis]|uniref:hypothetical protein n=1 Tax=Paenibacillus guangzhouensis TaxID=1473112 RepID=UPI0012673DE4|nr:hypothetical protein [Paenibacillus guangzhouensis]
MGFTGITDFINELKEAINSIKDTTTNSINGINQQIETISNHIHTMNILLMILIGVSVLRLGFSIYSFAKRNK